MSVFLYFDLQDVVLPHFYSRLFCFFPISSKRNILFGAKEETKLTEAEWQTIFEKSALTNEIKIFPKNKETLVGEKGISFLEDRKAYALC